MAPPRPALIGRSYNAAKRAKVTVPPVASPVPAGPANVDAVSSTTPTPPPSQKGSPFLQSEMEADLRLKLQRAEAQVTANYDAGVEKDNQILELQVALANARSDINTLKTRKQTEAYNVQSLTEQLAETDEAKKATTEQLEAAQRSGPQKDAQIKKLEGAVSQLNSSLNDAHESLREARKQRNDLNATTIGLHAELDSAEGDLQELQATKNELAATEGQLASISQELENIFSDIGGKKLEVSEYLKYIRQEHENAGKNDALSRPGTPSERSASPSLPINPELAAMKRRISWFDKNRKPPTRSMSDELAAADAEFAAAESLDDDPTLQANVYTDTGTQTAPMAKETQIIEHTKTVQRTVKVTVLPWWFIIVLLALASVLASILAAAYFQVDAERGLWFGANELMRHAAVLSHRALGNGGGMRWAESGIYEFERLIAFDRSLLG